MMGTFNCVYEIPCGWCSKWDKKCDRKIKDDKFTSTDKLAAMRSEKPTPGRMIEEELK